MSRKNKLRKFADLLSFDNTFECYNVQKPELVGNNFEKVEMRGSWHETYFKNNNPITLELACGAGEYTVGLGRLYPNRNFIGVDVKGNRIWRGAKDALDAGLQNVAFLRTRIEIIAHFFAPNEVSEIWITFCDPFPRLSKSNRRLTSPFFLEEYRKILAPGGLVHLKHDDPDFCQYTREVLDEDPRCTVLFQNNDIYAEPELPFPELGIPTLYEKKHLEAGKKIRYLRFEITK